MANEACFSKSNVSPGFKSHVAIIKQCAGVLGGSEEPISETRGLRSCGGLRLLSLGSGSLWRHDLHGPEVGSKRSDGRQPHPQPHGTNGKAVPRPHLSGSLSRHGRDYRRRGATCNVEPRQAVNTPREGWCKLKQFQYFSPVSIFVLLLSVMYCL